MISATIATCFSNVLLRSSLNVIDRFLFGKKIFGFFYLYFLTMALPFLIGALFLLQLGELGSLWRIFTSPSCFFLSISTQLVGLSFSYAFRHHEVRQVILRAKLPELFLPLLLMIPFWTSEHLTDPFTWKTALPMITTWIGILPLIIWNNSRPSYFDKATLFVSGSLLIQMFFSSHIPIESNSYSETIGLTTGILLWRCFFTVPFCFFKQPGTPQEEPKEKFSLRMVNIMLLRSFISFGTLLTFTWCILEGNPLLIWPILNMTPLVATAASHLILKEKVDFTEQIALIGFFAGTSLTLIL